MYIRLVVSETAAYIRVSTDEQDPERQFQDISEEYDVPRSNLYADVEHGDVFTGRDGYGQLLEDAEEYDSVVFTELTRLGRSTRGMRDALDTLLSDDCSVVLLDEGWEFTPGEDDLATGIMRDILTRMAEDELRRIRERTRSGIRQAKREGKHVGRTPKGFTVDDGFLVPEAGTYECVCEFVREVNKGRAKSTTAEFFGFKAQSAQSILETTQKYNYDVEYIGDDEWRKRRTEVKTGDREVGELNE